MKNIKYILLLISIVLIFTTCKKYPQGGLVGQTRLHLFGGHKAGCSKTWKLKLYEVNGIDSTNLIQGANTIPDFYNKFVTFKYNKADPSPEYSSNTYIQNYVGSVDDVHKQIIIAYDWKTHQDSVQCKTIGSQSYCQRNIFFPEFLSRNPIWDIKKLTSSEFIITVQLTNSYKIILTH